MDDLVRESQRRRFDYLQMMYRRSKGIAQTSLDMYQLGSELGLSREAVKDVTEYLYQEGFVGMTHDGSIWLEQMGANEVESMLTARDKPTEYFPSYNYLYVGSMTHSQIQQGTSGSEQHGQWTTSEMGAVEEIVRLLRQELASLKLESQARAQLDADLSTLESQRSAPQPNAIVMRESLSSIRSVIESAAGSAAASQLPRILELIGSLPGM